MNSDNNTLSNLISYSPAEGKFFLIKAGRISRQIFPDEEGYLTFFNNKKKYKLKADKVAVEIGWGLKLQKDKTILHLNLDTSDNRLKNLRVISRKIYNKIKEAKRNLDGQLKMLPHSQDVFSYILTWREDGKDRVLVVQDVVVAKRLFTKLQLKYAKVLAKYCVFD